MARYLDHIKRLKSEKSEHLLKEADTRLVQQQELHTDDLKELEEQYETQLRISREKMETILKSKLKSAEMASQREKEALDHVLKTIKLTQNQMNDCESRVNALEQTNLSLTDALRNLQTGLRIERSQANDLQAEVNNLQEELTLEIEQYQELVKEEADDSLSLEIAKFNHLLSNEEKRIKLLEGS